MNNTIKNIIVTVNDDTSEIKMNVIASLSRKSHIKIYLVTFVNNENVTESFSVSSLLKMYRRLKTSAHCPVEYSLLHGRNKARTILKFAEQNEADVLLLTPGSETKFGWPNKDISDVIPPASKVQVLTV